MIDMIMCDKTQKECYFLGVQILMRTFNIREKSQNNGGGIPTEMLIAQQPKAIESRNWYQIIVTTTFLNHEIRYINNQTFVLFEY